MTAESEIKRECHLRELLSLRIDKLEELNREQFGNLKEGIKVAKESVDQRLEKLNEVRAMVSEWRASFEPIGKIDAVKEQILSRIESVRKELLALIEVDSQKVASIDKIISNFTGRVTATVGILGFVTVAASALVSLLIQKMGH